LGHTDSHQARHRELERRVQCRRKEERILLLLLLQGRSRMIGHSPVGAFSGHNSVARPYRTLGNLRVAPRLKVVPAQDGAAECAMLGPFEMAARRWYVYVMDLLMAVVDFRFLCCTVCSFGVLMLVVMRSLKVLSHHQSVPTSRLDDQNNRYCLGLKGRRLQNYLMSPPRSCRTLVRLIDLNFQSAIGL
jgi:hypothetical protein